MAARTVGVSVLLLACAICLGSMVYAQTSAIPLIKSGCEVDYPPFCIVHEDGRADGFSVELLTAALQRMGREVTYRTGPWSEVRGWLERGEIDALPLVGRTPEREQLFDFTVPYLTMHGAIVVRQDTTDIHSLADLSGRIVSVMATDNAEEFLRREPRDFEIVTEPTFADAFRLLAAGNCDAVIIQRLVAIRLLEETGLTGELRIVEQPILDFAQDFCFAVTEGDHDLLAILNEGLALVMADGTHRSLYTKWFAHLQLPSDRAIVIGGDANYPPFEFLDEDGHPQGYNVDLIRAVAQAAGLTAEIHLGVWTDVLQALERGEIDALEGVFYSPERDRVYDFSQAHIVNHSVAVIRKGEGSPPSSLEELEGKRIVVQAGDIMHDFVIENGLEEHATAVASQERALLDLSRGEYDCALVARSTALYWIDEYGWRNLAVGRTPLLSSEYCFAVPVGNKALLAELSEGLATIEQSGEYQQIYEKWMGVYDPDLKAQRTLRYVLMILGALMIVIILFLVWVRSLRRQVTRRTAALAALSHRYQAILDEIPDIVMEVDARKTYVWSNPAGYAFFGDEVIGTDASEYFVGEQQTDQAVQQLFDGSEDIVYVETLQRRRDGVERLLAWWCRVLKDDTGSVIGALSTARDITDQRQAEEDLEAQYRLLRVAGETARFGGWSVALATNICTWSDTVADIHGMPQGFSPNVEEGIEFYAPEWRDKIAQLFRDCAERGMPYDEEMEIVTHSGQRVWVRTVGQAIRDESGRIVQVQGSLQDISDRKQAEWRIVHLNRVLRAIRDVNQLITHETNRDELLNRACKILISTRGFSSAWVAAQEDDGRIHAASEAGIGEDFPAMQDAFESETAIECVRAVLENPAEITVIHNTDTNCKSCPLCRTHRDTAALAGALRYGDETYGAIVVALPRELADDKEEQSLFKELVGDISYALRAIQVDEEHLRAQDALLESATALQEAQRLASIGNWSWRFETDRLSLSDEMYSIIGLEQDGNAVKTSVHEQYYTKESWQRFIDASTAARESGTPYEIELEILREGERNRHAVARGEPIYDSDGMIIGLRGTLQDTTDRHYLDVQLRQAQKMESIGRLAGGVAHDFNNLLMGIMNYAELCRGRIEEDHPIRKWLDEIIHEAERSANLTRQLLAFARKQTIAPKIIDLNEAVAGMLRMLRRLIGEHIDLEWKPGDEMWMVKIDPGQLDQILANLCVNARDAIGEAGRVIIETANAPIGAEYCTLHADATPGDYVMLGVSDDGRGMDRETLEHAFEPFYTTKGPSEGTGLGLATVYGIVRQNGGFVNAYSEKGEGSTLRIYFPRADEDEAKERPTEVPKEQFTGRETVLLVEDEASIRETVKLLLESLGYLVMVAPEPETALGIGAEHKGKIDLLITDVVMPGMSGKELAERLMASDSRLKVLYMSGYTANVIAHRGILDDGVSFVSKPVSRDDLARAIRALLDSG